MSTEMRTRSALRCCVSGSSAGSAPTCASRSSALSSAVRGEVTGRGYRAPAATPGRAERRRGGISSPRSGRRRGGRMLTPTATLGRRSQKGREDLDVVTRRGDSACEDARLAETLPIPVFRPEEAYELDIRRLASNPRKPGEPLATPGVVRVLHTRRVAGTSGRVDARARIRDQSEVEH